MSVQKDQGESCDVCYLRKKNLHMELTKWLDWSLLHFIAINERRNDRDIQVRI